MTDTLKNETIQAALRKLRGRIRTRFLVHGLGWLLGAVSALLLISYGLDRGLVMPRGIRIFLLLAITGYLVMGFRRRMLYPLGRSFTDRDLALLIERTHPELHQELVSAVQLAESGAREASPELVKLVVAGAARDLDRVDHSSLLRAKRTLRVWGVAAGFLVLLASQALLSFDSFGVWARRFFGAELPYPRATFLTLHIPDGQGNYRVVSDTQDALLVDVAKGADLPINVDVTGTVPDFVELVARPIGKDRQDRVLFMSRRGESRFRYVARRCLQGLELYARGGDDPGTRPVRVRILIPPSPTGVRVSIQAPAYTGLPVVEREGGLVEALPGSQVRLRLRVDGELEKAWLEFQESGEKLVMQRAAPMEAAVGDKVRKNEKNGILDSDAESIWMQATFPMPEKKDRYRIRLLAKNGLGERQASLYSVIPLRDRKPFVRLLTPGSGLTTLTPGAVFPLRVSVEDDYGLSQLTMEAKLGSSGETKTSILWPPERTGNEGVALRTPERVTRKLASLDLLEPKTMLPKSEREIREGDRLSFRVIANDNRVPGSQRSLPQGFRIDLVDVPELRRRLQSRMRSIRRAVDRVRQVQAEQRDKLQSTLATGNKDEISYRFGVTAGEAGQQRVRASLLRIRADFSEVLDSHLFNGLDSSPSAKDVVDAYLEFYRKSPDALSSDPRFYAEVNRRRAKGRIGRLDLLGRLADMFGVVHGLLEEQVQQSLRDLAKASTAAAPAEALASLRALGKEQQEIIEGLDHLLSLLEDWNEYQDVIRMTRRIRDSLKDLMDRVRSDFGSPVQKR